MGSRSPGDGVLTAPDARGSATPDGGGEDDRAERAVRRLRALGVPRRQAERFGGTRFALSLFAGFFGALAPLFEEDERKPEPSGRAAATRAALWPLRRSP